MKYFGNKDLFLSENTVQILYEEVIWHMERSGTSTTRYSSDVGEVLHFLRDVSSLARIEGGKPLALSLLLRCHYQDFDLHLPQSSFRAAKSHDDTTLPICTAVALSSSSNADTTGNFIDT